MRFFFCRFLLESAVGLFLICGVVLRLSIWIFYISKIQMGGIYGEICTKKGIYQRKWRLCGIILHGVLPLQGIRPDYMDKLFIPIQGCLLEVVREQYTDFYRDKERWRYLQKLDTKNRLLSLDGFTDSEGNPLDFITDEAVDIAETVVNAVMVDRLKAPCLCCRIVNRS